MNKGDRVKLLRDLTLVLGGDTPSTTLVAGSRGVAVDTGKTDSGEAMALVSFPVIDHATVVVDCKRLMVIR